MKKQLFFFSPEIHNLPKKKKISQWSMNKLNYAFQCIWEWDCFISEIETWRDLLPKLFPHTHRVSRISWRRSLSCFWRIPRPPLEIPWERWQSLLCTCSCMSSIERLLCDKKKIKYFNFCDVFMIVKQFTTLYFDYGSTEINYFPGQYHGRKRIGRFPTHCSNLLIHMTIKSLLNFKDNLSFFLMNLPSLLLAWILHVPVLCFTNHNTATNLAA